MVLVQAQASDLPTAEERAAIAEAAAADAGPSRWEAPVAFLSGEPFAVADKVRRVLEDRQATCRQAAFIQSRLPALAELVGEENDDLALIHMWAGFVQARSCGEPRGDPLP